jgi:hypothetical protein
LAYQLNAFWVNANRKRNRRNENAYFPSLKLPLFATASCIGQLAAVYINVQEDARLSKIKVSEPDDNVPTDVYGVTDVGNKEQGLGKFACVMWVLRLCCVGYKQYDFLLSGNGIRCRFEVIEDVWAVDRVSI